MRDLTLGIVAIKLQQHFFFFDPGYLSGEEDPPRTAADRCVICRRQTPAHRRSVKQKSEKKGTSRAAGFRGEAGRNYNYLQERLLSMFPDFRPIPRENNLAGWNIWECSERRQRHVEEIWQAV